MKLTKIYTSIVEAINLKVDEEYHVKDADTNEQISLKVKTNSGDKQLKLTVPNKEATYKSEPGDVVRFHPLAESIFDMPSETIRFFTKAMTQDLTMRIVTLAAKMVELAEIKKSGGNLNAKQIVLMKNVPYTKTAVKYFTQCLGKVGKNKPALITVTNKRGYEVEGTKHARVCIIETDPMDYNQEHGVFSHPCDSANSFKMTLNIFKNILSNLNTVQVSNIKSSPTFISLLTALSVVSGELNRMALVAYGKDVANDVHRNDTWVKCIDDLPDLYQKEYPVQLIGNVGLNRTEKEVPVEEAQVDTVVDSDTTDTSLLPESATPSTVRYEPTEIKPNTTEPTADTSNQMIASPAVVETQIPQKENTMFNDIPKPASTLGANNNQNNVTDFFPQQQQSQQVQQPQQFVQMPEPSQAQITARVISDEHAGNIDSENAAHLKAQSSEPAARETATSCHAIDLHGQPLFRMNGQPYIIKGANGKLNMIHRSDENGAWLFKTNGDPVLGPLTYKQDGTAHGIRDVGKVNQHNRNQQSGNQQQFNQQQSNSLASRLSGSNNNDVLFPNMNNNAQQFNGLSQNDINTLLRQGVPRENIQNFMNTGNKAYLTANNVGSVSSGNGLSDSNLQSCLNVTIELFKANKLSNDQALGLQKAIQSKQLTRDTAVKLMAMYKQFKSQQNDIFDLNSSVGQSDNSSPEGFII